MRAPCLISLYPGGGTGRTTDAVTLSSPLHTHTPTRNTDSILSIQHNLLVSSTAIYAALYGGAENRTRKPVSVLGDGAER